MHALEIHGALLFVRLFSGNCLGFGYHDNQGIYKELCATNWDCKRLQHARFATRRYDHSLALRIDFDSHAGYNRCLLLFLLGESNSTLNY